MQRAFVAIAAGIALADASIVTLGLPSILVDLHTSVDGVALVLGVYVAVLALTLIPASALARSIGAPRLAAGGMALFCLASLGCGASNSLGLLLAFRVVQAVGAAGALVAAFDLLDAGAPGPGRRLWVVASVFGIAIGPALGGALTQTFDWRAIFFAQAPIALPGMLAALLVVRREDAGRAPGDDALEATSREAGPASRLPLRPAIALALLSAALTAVVFLVVLLLVAGWSVEPLAAALAVTVLPVSAAISYRVGGSAEARAAAGCLLVAGGVGCLALVPSASSWWVVLPQVLAGAGMGLALPALSGELLPERTRRDVARLLSIRHAGIAVALALLASIVSANLDSTIATAREQGTAAVLDARIDPVRKLSLAPQLIAGINTDDPRGQLQRSIADARSGASGSEATAIDRLGTELDDVVTGAVRSAFQVAFIVTAALALAAALVLLLAGPALDDFRRGAVTLGAAAGVIAIGAYGVAYASSETKTVPIGNPCQARALPSTGGIGGTIQDLSLQTLDRAACDLGSSREELLLALFNDADRKRFEAKYGKDPRSLGTLGGALLGL